MRKSLFLAAILTITLISKAQSFSINTDGSIADTSAILDVKSTLKGLLIPRMTKIQRNTIYQPATGLLIFQSGPDSTGFHYYNGTTWIWLAGSAVADTTAWKVRGNAGTDSTINFLGTTDNKPLMLRQNNLWMGQLNSSRHNFFIGGGAGQHNTAQLNTAFGDSALFNNTTGSGNTAIGSKALAGIAGPVTGGLNVAIGMNALVSDTSGSQNVVIGNGAAISLLSGTRNIIIGPSGMEIATKGNDNIGLGLWTLRLNDSSSNNIAIGNSALYLNKRSNNVAIGHLAGYYNSYLQSSLSTGIENTYVGYQSGYWANTGSKNTAVGHHALIGSGYFTGDGDNGFKRNTAIGDSALASNTGNDNTAVGVAALSKQSYQFNNVAVGDSAMALAAGTNQNVAIGSKALMRITGNYPNTGIGYLSMDSLTTGVANTAVGSRSLVNMTTGSRNTAIGDSALWVNKTGSFNIALGYRATTATNALVNATAIGSNAWVAQNNSIVLGSITGLNGATANTNVGIGITTPDSIFSVSNNFSVGSQGTIQFANTTPVMMHMFKSGTANADRMVIAHSIANPTSGLQYQDIGDRFNFLNSGTAVMTIDLPNQRVGIGTPIPTHVLQLSVDDAAKPGTSVWIIASDERLKTIDGSYTKGLQDVLKLNTILFHYKKGNTPGLPSDEQYYGFSAQEVQKIYPEAVKTGKDGYLNFNMHPILVSFINAFKEQQQQIVDQKKQLDGQQKIINELVKRVEKLENK